MLNLITLLKHYYKFFSEETNTININLLFNLLYLIKKLECVNNKIQDISNLEIIKTLDLKNINNVNSMRQNLGNIARGINMIIIKNNNLNKKNSEINLNYKEDLILNFVKEEIKIFLEIFMIELKKKEL